MKIHKVFIDLGDKDVAVPIGTTEKGDMVVDGGFVVTEAFNGTSPVIDMGFVADNQGGSADPNALASAVAVATLGAKPADELAAATNKPCTVPDTITVTFSTSGGSTTTGKGYAWVAILNGHPFNER